ncbi:NAD-dependent epimerase/dehydratase family protein [Maliponia aquimaris]|uniref:NAD dependent epimerase/dehydratase family protein n=1 Tax=Maliponia aquimaris TaxID=1673631 RepID=A0A238JNN5_9RHOB|nr:NAD-dependent epimerase/dehydratase family protein [Maliponia aquimaris]SMX32290.1 NAD dependent epimerase/dehydratase family protein [Maliponia aquimaris]
MAGTLQSCEVLVLGASGKLGGMLCRLWRPEGWRLVPVVRRDRGLPGALTWEPGFPPPDLHGVKAIVALWGVTPGAGRNLSDNARLAKAAVDLGASLKAETIVHCSSGAVYRPTAGPVPETTPADPQSAYGVAKREMEEVIEATREAGGARQIVLRIGNVAGADSLFANLHRGGRVVLDDFGHHDGPSRSYIAPQDLARVIEALIRDPGAQGIFNVAAPRPTRMADLGRAGGATISWRPAPDTAFPMMWLETTRLSRHVRLPERSADADWLVAAAAEAGAFA